MGPQGYVEAHAKNDKVLPLVVPSGESGTLDDALYYSWLSVKKGRKKLTRLVTNLLSIILWVRNSHLSRTLLLQDLKFQ